MLNYTRQLLFLAFIHITKNYIPRVFAFVLCVISPEIRTPLEHLSLVLSSNLFSVLVTSGPGLLTESRAHDKEESSLTWSTFNHVAKEKLLRKKPWALFFFASCQKVKWEHLETALKPRLLCTWNWIQHHRCARDSHKNSDQGPVTDLLGKAATNSHGGEVLFHLWLGDGNEKGRK